MGFVNTYPYRRLRGTISMSLLLLKESEYPEPIPNSLVPFLRREASSSAQEKFGIKTKQTTNKIPTHLIVIPFIFSSFFLSGLSSVATN
jgi:hypothetical protein